MTRSGAVVTQLVPAAGAVPVEDSLVDFLCADLELPFSEQRVEFVSAVSRAIMAASGRRPELQALGFWMRRSALARMAESFRAGNSMQSVVVPRGTVFHIPPANVDTMFAYSWMLSVLAGNRNVVRMSSRTTEQAQVLLDIVAPVLMDWPDVASGTRILSYGHDDVVTAVLSANCDVRVVWGGDSTVQRVRQIGLPPHSRDVSFPDRFSMAAISVSAYQAMDSEGRTLLAEKFFNDAYWFDQMGCSSPRLLIWVGAADAGSASTDFFERVQRVAAAKAHNTETGSAIAKLTQAMRGMIDLDAVRFEWMNNSVVTLETSSFPDVRGEFCGSGFFYQMQVEALAEVSPHIRRSDQTLAVFGIDERALHDFVGSVKGRGIDRIVPIGQALAFGHVWDGMDLLREFTRLVTVQPTVALP